MPPTPSPTPIDVFVHSGPAEWWQIFAALGPLAVLLGAIVAGLVGWNTLRERSTADAKALAQKAEADNRAEWWKRTQWALDAIYSGDKKKTLVGLKVLGVLGESTLAGPGELTVLEAAWEKPLSDAERALPEKRAAEKAVDGSTGGTAEPATMDAVDEVRDNLTDKTNADPDGGKP